MDLRTALVKTTSLEDLEPLVKKAKENATFFGHRYIYVDGYDGTLPIDALALRVMTLLEKNSDFKQHPNELVAANNTITLIKKIYAQNLTRWNPLAILRDGITVLWRFCTLDTDFCGVTVYHYWGIIFDDGIDEDDGHFRVPPSLFPEVTRELAERACKEASSFEELAPLVQNAKADVSILGSRYVKIEGHDGSLSIYALAQRVMEIAKNTLNYTKDKDYQEIAPLVTALFQSSDERKEEKNLLTRIVCSTRDFWNDNNQIRMEWKQHSSKIDSDEILKEN